MDHLNAAMAARPELAPQFLDRVVAAGVRYGDRPLCTTPRPVVLSPRTVTTYRHMLRSLHTAVRTCREWIVADGLDGRPGSLAPAIGVTPDALRLAAMAPPDPSAAVLARLDTFLVDGVPHMVELNAESPAGMAYGDALSDLFLGSPELGLPEGLSPMHVAPLAAQAVLDTWAGTIGKSRVPTVAIVDLRESPTRPEFLLFQRQFERLGVRCHVADPSDLHFADGRLWLGDDVINVVYRRLLVSDVLAHPDRCAPLIAAYRAGATLVVNSFRTALLHGKGLFALLHDPAYQARLPPDVQRSLHRHMPWTGILANHPGPGAPADLRERVRRDPAPWVLKPLDGHGGSGVLLGWRTDRATWERAVDNAHAHVVQRRIPTPREVFPDACDGNRLKEMLISLDPFLVRGELAGFLCRVSPDHLANVTSGASQVPVLVAPD